MFENYSQKPKILNQRKIGHRTPRQRRQKFDKYFMN